MSLSVTVVASGLGTDCSARAKSLGGVSGQRFAKHIWAGKPTLGALNLQGRLHADLARQLHGVHPSISTASSRVDPEEVRRLRGRWPHDADAPGL
jgi:hypothetical protein